MAVAKLFISAATTLSDPNRWEELIRPGIEGLEAGFLADGDLPVLVALAQRHGLPWGVHSPLHRGGLTNEILGPDGLLPDAAAQLLQEAERLSGLGARYLLAHFPWFAGDNGTAEVVARGLQDLLSVQTEAGLPLILEPKLGIARHPGGIGLLHRLGPDALRGARLCLDLGDWWLAAQGLGISCATLIRPFLPLAATLHLHHVNMDKPEYIWTPIHPSTDAPFGFHAIIQEAMAANPDLILVLEHTPHLVTSEAYVREGIEWLHSVISS